MARTEDRTHAPAGSPVVALRELQARPQAPLPPLVIPVVVESPVGVREHDDVAVRRSRVGADAQRLHGLDERGRVAGTPDLDHRGRAGTQALAQPEDDGRAQVFLVPRLAAHARLPVQVVACHCLGPALVQEDVLASIDPRVQVRRNQPRRDQLAARVDRGIYRAVVLLADVEHAIVLDDAHPVAQHLVLSVGVADYPPALDKRAHHCHPKH